MQTVRMAFIPNPFGVACYAALASGFFADEGLAIEATTLRNGSLVAEALTDGAIDCGVGGHLQTLEAVIRGDDQVFISPLAFERQPDNLCICLVARQDLTSPRDLEGRTVALNVRGPISDLQLEIAMRRAGAQFSKANVAVMPFAGMREALERGDIDAASVVEPFASQLVADGLGAILDSGSLSGMLQPGERVMITGMATRRSWLERNQQIAAAVARAVRRGIQQVGDDSAAARRIIAGYTGLPASIVDMMRLPYMSSELHSADLQKAFDLAAEYGVVSQRVGAEDLMCLL
jgi:NitT/TauT family transport system substrate-binding protein